MKNIVFISVLFLTVALSGCQKHEDHVIIGTFGAMTGAEASFGISTYNGVLLAVEEWNQKGGLLKESITLKFYDDQGKTEDAKLAVERLIRVDEVIGLIGESASTRSLAAAPVAQMYQIPMISPSSTSPSLTKIGDYIFRACFIDPFQGEVMAKFAFETLKFKKGAILRDSKSDYSVGLADYFKRTFEKLGGKIVEDKEFVAGDVEFMSQLKKIKASHPDFIFVPAYYTEVGIIARQAKQIHLNIPFLGGDGWDSGMLSEIAGDALEGSYFTNHYSQENPSGVVVNFVNKYRKRFDSVPDSQAASAYDAANILFEAIEKANSTNGKAIRDAIAATKDFKGVTGTIWINENRDATKSAVVLQVQGKKFKYVTTINPTL